MTFIDDVRKETFLAVRGMTGSGIEEAEEFLGFECDKDGSLADEVRVIRARVHGAAMDGGYTCDFDVVSGKARRLLEPTGLRFQDYGDHVTADWSDD